MKTTKRTRVLTLKLSLSTAFIAAVGLTALLIATISSLYSSRFVRDAISSRLHDLVALGVQQINGDRHAQILTEEDADGTEFLELLDSLNAIKKINQDITYIYTLRSGSEGLYFVVDADPDKDSRASVGYPVEEPTAAMLQAWSEKTTVVEDSFYTDEWGTFMSAYAPLFRQSGELDGLLGIDIAVGTVRAYQLRTVVFLVLISVLVTLAAIAGSLWLSTLITRPITRVTDDMLAIRHFSLDGVVDVRSGIHEIQEMVDALENMKKSLRSFKKYVPAELVADLITLNKEAVLEAERRDITVFFSDIADFTTISEQLQPDILSRSLGQYLARLTGIILDSRGIVDKYIGDAIMALWGAPHALENHAVAACRAALLCQQAVAELNVQYKQAGVPPFITRIGLNSGEAIVGNMGYEERLSYTAIGDNVNLASRLEGLNKLYGTNILVSEHTADAVGTQFALRLVDVVAVKGKSKGVRVYELVGETAAIDSPGLKAVEKSNTAMDLYLQRRWAEALALFTELSTGGGRWCELMAARCREFISHDPGAQWTGVVYLREK
ncbi:MAG: adenylate/guanylate cyclase domain-containing protein [Spirochaetes bacterium]|nr:adenylate/guanylate cyclase domain-containing protein [Spirochaetota bacterium]